MKNDYTPKFIAEAYDSLIAKLKSDHEEEIKYLEDEAGKEFLETTTTEKVLSKFILDHLGKEKLWEVAKQVDDAIKKECGKDIGWIDWVEMEFGVYRPEA